MPYQISNQHNNVSCYSLASNVGCEHDPNVQIWPNPNSRHGVNQIRSKALPSPRLPAHRLSNSLDPLCPNTITTFTQIVAFSFTSTLFLSSVVCSPPQKSAPSFRPLPRMSTRSRFTGCSRGPGRLSRRLGLSAPWTASPIQRPSWTWTTLSAPAPCRTRSLPIASSHSPPRSVQASRP